MHRRFRFFALLLLAFSTATFAQKTAAPPDPYKPVLDRLEAISAMPLTGWQAHQANLSHGEQAATDTTGWQPIKVREDWQGPRWLRQNIEIPAALNGYNLQGARVSLDLHVSSDVDIRVAVFANGNMMARTDEDGQVPIVLTGNAQPGQKFDIAVRVEESGGASCCGGNSTRIYRAQLLIEPPPTRPDPAMMRLEILSAEPLIAAYPDGKAERQQQLGAAVSAINLDALSRGDQQAFDASLREAQQKLQVLQPYMRQFKVSAVGNSHIDMAWLWPWTETVEVVRNTFGTALELMREYPDFKFTASTAQAYTWIEEKYPDMFKEIQQRVKEGRWEVIGGMWVEPDLNMPDGESLVRQILYGKRYFRDKFGVDIHIGWNPDSFGYNWQLPQIYKRSGIDSFVTQKLLWASDFYKFPYRLFWWQSPDGSRMLTYFPSDYANAIDPDKIARDSATYGPMMWKYNGGANAAPAGSLDMMYLYGVGDHGGGPTRQDLDTALRWQKPDVVFPSLQFSTAADFIADLDKNQANLNLPVWDNELYFQYHRGVFTTQSEEKRGNRQNEELILDAEKLAAIDSLFGAAYPEKNFDDSWKKILFNQFHDILPGSGIGINYVDAARKYEVASRLSNDTIHAALNDLASRVVSDGVNVLVFNPLSWARTGEVEAEVQFPLGARDVSAVDFEGKPIPVVVLNNEWQTGRVRVRLLAKNIPPTGYKLIQLLPRAASVAPKTTLLATDTTLENEFVRVTVDPATGCITSLYDKRGEAEALALPDGQHRFAGGHARRQALRQSAASFRGQAAALGRLERGRRLRQPAHRPDAGRRSEAGGEHAAARGHSREAPLPEIQLRAGHHPLPRRAARGRAHDGRLARAAHPAEGGVPGAARRATRRPSRFLTAASSGRPRGAHRRRRRSLKCRRCAGPISPTPSTASAC